MTFEHEFLIRLVPFWLKCRLFSMHDRTKDRWLGTLGQMDYEVEMKILIERNRK
jgi:hypothetical protein